MQHYGVPTRLLDVTTNALVALYFACEDKKKSVDGVVYVIRPDDSKIKMYDSDAVSILSSLPRFNYKEKKLILESAQDALSEAKDSDNCGNCYLNKFISTRIIKRLLHGIKKEKPAYENIINPNDLLTNFFFVPRKVNARIIRQSGAFIIFGLQEKTIEINDEAFSNTSSGSYKIIIKGSEKKNIIDQLSCFGILSILKLNQEIFPQ